MIEISNVTKEFDTVKALDNVNIKIDKSDIYGIIGYSGAGKSTLIRCINRLEEVTSGKVEINGEDITKYNNKELRQVRKKIGMIFQHFNLLNSRTVYQNIAYPMEICGVPKDKIAKKIDELLELVELKDKKNSYPSQLSGGQKQRVGIARALANDPMVLLCDEATSALDPTTTLAILNLLKKINRELGLTIVIITHEMEVIKQICNKVAVMEKGRVVEQGNITDVFANPSESTTKRFVYNISHDMPVEFYSNKENKKLVRLNFKGDITKKPVISNMIKKYAIDVNILLGGVDKLQENIVGNLVVELLGDSKEIKCAIEYLEDNNVRCEVIENGR